MLVFRCPNEHVFTFDLGAHLEPMQALRFRESTLTTFCPTCWEQASVRGTFVIGQNAAGQPWMKSFVEQILSDPNARDIARTVVDELQHTQELLSHGGEQPDASTVSSHTRGVLENIRALTPTEKLATIVVVIELLRALIDLSTALTSDNDPPTVYQYTIEQQTIEKQVIRRDQPRAAGEPPGDELAEYEVVDLWEEAAYSGQVMRAYRVAAGTDWGQTKADLFRLLIEVYIRLHTLLPGCDVTLQVEPNNEVGQYSEIMVHLALPGIVTEDVEGPEAPEVQELLQRYMVFRRWLDGLNVPARQQLKFNLRFPLLRRNT